MSRSAINRGEAFNTAATGAADILAADIAPTSAAFGNVAMRLTIGIKPGGTTSVLNLQVNSGATAILLALNGGTALTVGALYTFTFGVSSTYTYNLQMATTTVIGYMLLEELQDGVV